MTDTAPILASSLLTDKELDHILAGVISGVSERDDDAEERLTTGFRHIDTAVLDGGLESGRVVEVAGDEGSGRAEISKAFLTSFLFQHNSNNQKRTAAVVDTTGNFDVVGLYASLLTKLVKEQQMQKSEAEKTAAEMLDRVKIMRVFDFEGVREAVDEIRGEIEAGLASEKEDAKGGKKRTYVADSEDEEDEDEEMLFDPSPPAAASKQENNIPSTPKFVLIDNLTQVVSPLLKQDTVQGPSQTSTLLTTLANLTHTHALYTLLVTPLTSTSTSVPPPRAPPSPTRLEQDKDMAPPALSIFCSNKATSGMSALAALMGLYVDVRVVVSWVPRRRGDARLYYADEGGRRRMGRKGECGGVVEVVGDRWGRRMGAWGVFGV